MSDEVELLAIAAHRDDVELTCGGTLAKAVQQGHRVGIVDLTQGERFGRAHSPDELWKIILWVRQFPNLSAQERAAIQARMKAEEPGEAEH